MEIHVNRRYNGVTQVPGEDLRGGNTGTDVFAREEHRWGWNGPGVSQRVITLAPA